MIGTPPYMAPEQHRGEASVEASDQYGFCVALFEALYGERPFRATTSMRCCAAKLRRRAALSARAAVTCPRGCTPWWSAVSRRCPRALADDGCVARRARARTGARPAAAHSRDAARCSASRLPGSRGCTSWTSARGRAPAKRPVRASPRCGTTRRGRGCETAFVATGVSYGATTADKVMPWLDAHASAWQQARTEACLNEDVRGVWDEDTLDRALWCLDERKMELEALTTELLAADAPREATRSWQPRGARERRGVSAMRTPSRGRRRHRRRAPRGVRALRVQLCARRGARAHRAIRRGARARPLGP